MRTEITPTIDLPRSKVRQTTIDRETGEIIERVIPHSDFRPRPPRHPGPLDATRIDWIARDGREGVTGRSAVYVLAHRESEVAYWEHFGHHLTTTEQRHLARDEESNSVLRPIPPEWKPGDRMYIARDMEAEVIEVTESHRGYGTVFKVHDYRVMYLKAGTLGGSATPKVDEHGYPADPTDDETEKARIESAYTSVASQSIDEAGGVMTDAEYARIHPDQSAGNALLRRRAKAAVTVDRLQQRLAEAKAKNRTSTVRYLERQLKSLERRGGLRRLGGEHHRTAQPNASTEPESPQKA